MCRVCVAVLAAVALMLFAAACSGPRAATTDAEPPPQPAIGEGGVAPVSGVEPAQELQNLFDDLGFLPYLGIRPVRQAPGDDGFVEYDFDYNEVRGFAGEVARARVSRGSSDNVMLFMDGGGAVWPGGGLYLGADNPLAYEILRRTDDNPVHDWNYVYVPYCDASLHLGDNIYEYPWGKGYHQGMRHTAAAVALMKELFPHAPKVLVAGVSAGGFGTLYGWAIAKSQYLDAETFVLSDSGVGFWNPDDLAMWQAMQTAWNLHMPPQCEKCDGPIMTYLYETYMDLDPQVRVGLFSSYRDWVMSAFTGMTQDQFQYDLLSITDNIRQAQPDRFGRFFIKGRQHTSLQGGLGNEIHGVTYGEWIERMIYGNAPWIDELE